MHWTGIGHSFCKAGTISAIVSNRTKGEYRRRLAMLLGALLRILSSLLCLLMGFDLMVLILCLTIYS